MFKCQTCGYECRPGSLFCSDCGSILLDRKISAQPFIDVSSFRSINGTKAGKLSEAPIGNQDRTVQVIFVIPSTKRRITLELEEAIHIGRSDSHQRIEPDLDLTPDHGQDHGVSREHAVIRVGNQGVSLVDIGSANGTEINSRRLPPNEPYPLSNADIIKFGQLTVWIYLNQEATDRGT